MFFVNPPQNRHPERSASQIDACHSACGAESKDPDGAILPMLFGFSTTEPASDGPATVSPWNREPRTASWRRAKKLNLIRTINPEFKDLAQTWGWKMITVHEKMYP
jgi:hypothetical protein